MDFGTSLVLPFLYFPLFLIPKGCHDYSKIIAIQVLTLKGWHKKYCLLCWLCPIPPLQGLIFWPVKYFYNRFIPSGFFYCSLLISDNWFIHLWWLGAFFNPFIPSGFHFCPNAFYKSPFIPSGFFSTPKYWLHNGNIIGLIWQKGRPILHIEAMKTRWMVLFVPKYNHEKNLFHRHGHIGNADRNCDPVCLPPGLYGRHPGPKNNAIAPKQLVYQQLLHPRLPGWDGTRNGLAGIPTQNKGEIPNYP